MTAVLSEHVDDPRGPRHRLTLLDQQRLRCHDCARTLVLPSTAQPTSTSTASPRTPPRAGTAEECELHAGEWADACRLCRAERIADETRELPEPVSTEHGRAAAMAVWAAHQEARAAARSTTEEER